MPGEKPTKKVRISFGDPLLSAAAGLLAALGKDDEFPQDQAGIEALVARTAEGPGGEGVWASYEAPGDLPKYLGGYGTWIAPAGEGRLRLRQPQHGPGIDRLVSRAWILGADGSLGAPETIEGYGIPDAKLPETARTELEEIDSRRREAAARHPDFKRRIREKQNRFRVEHLVGVVAGPPDQDQTGLIVSHLILYDTGLIVNYLMPRPDAADLDPNDPWAETESARGELLLDDECGTKFDSDDGSVDPNGNGLLRCRREFTPAVSASASRVRVQADEVSVEIPLGPE